MALEKKWKFCDARRDGVQRHLLPQNKRGRLSLSPPLFRADCQSSRDNQYDREELVRPDNAAPCERSIYSFALPCIISHSSTSFSLLEVGLLVGSGFNLVCEGKLYADFEGSR